MPGENWKYGVGFLIGMVVTVIIIIVLANKYGKASSPPPPPPVQPTPSAPSESPPACTPDGAPSTSSGSDCCSANGVDDLGNCAGAASAPTVSFPPSSDSNPAIGTSSFSTEPADF